MTPTVERNAPCPCGLGKKFKKCHFLIDHESERQRWEELKQRMAREAAEARAARQERLRAYGRDDNGRALRGAVFPLVAMASLGVNR